MLLFICYAPLAYSGEGGIRTHAPLRTNGFQDRLVMTTSISLQQHFLNQWNCVCSCHDALSHHRFSNQRKNDSIISWTSCQYNFFIFFKFKNVNIKFDIFSCFYRFAVLHNTQPVLLCIFTFRQRSSKAATAASLSRSLFLFLCKLLYLFLE